MPKTAVKKYKALTNLSLRQSPDPQSPLYESWLDWKEGKEFVPPKHMNVAMALERGIVEEATEVKSDG